MKEAALLLRGITRTKDSMPLPFQRFAPMLIHQVRPMNHPVSSSRDGQGYDLFSPLPSAVCSGQRRHRVHCHGLLHLFQQYLRLPGQPLTDEKHRPRELQSLPPVADAHDTRNTVLFHQVQLGEGLQPLPPCCVSIRSGSYIHTPPRGAVPIPTHLFMHVLDYCAALLRQQVGNHLRKDAVSCLGRMDAVPK